MVFLSSYLELNFIITVYDFFSRFPFFQQKLVLVATASDEHDVVAYFVDLGVYVFVSVAGAFWGSLNDRRLFDISYSRSRCFFCSFRPCNCAFGRCRFYLFTCSGVSLLLMKMLLLFGAERCPLV